MIPIFILGLPGSIHATTSAYNSMRSFGVRQLAAALTRASLLAGDCPPGRDSCEQARREESGSKLPHSKASNLNRQISQAACRG